METVVDLVSAEQGTGCSVPAVTDSPHADGDMARVRCVAETYRSARCLYAQGARACLPANLAYAMLLSAECMCMLFMACAGAPAITLSRALLITTVCMPGSRAVAWPECLLPTYAYCVL